MITTRRVLAWRSKMHAQSATLIRENDPREVPLYSLSEAAVYLGIRESTLRSWVRGRTYPSQTGPRFFSPLLDAADPIRGKLSFANLGEAHILQATRDREIPIPRVREAIDYVQRYIKAPHPLISSDFHVFGKDLFIKNIDESDPVNASRGGQLGLGPILNALLERLERDNTGYPIRIFPVRTNRLVLDIKVASGQPVIKGTRIMARVLWGRRVSGDSVSDLATDYGISEGDVEEAIKQFDHAA
jgi:uncharacterized protein (DUF433 family)